MVNTEWVVVFDATGVEGVLDIELVVVMIVVVDGNDVVVEEDVVGADEVEDIVVVYTFRS